MQDWVVHGALVPVIVLPRRIVMDGKVVEVGSWKMPAGNHYHRTRVPKVSGSSGVLYSLPTVRTTVNSWLRW
jgi:hypothetical protein